MKKKKIEFSIKDYILIMKKVVWNYIQNPKYLQNPCFIHLEKWEQHFFPA